MVVRICVPRANVLHFNEISLNCLQFAMQIDANDMINEHASKPTLIDSDFVFFIIVIYLDQYLNYDLYVSIIVRNFVSHLSSLINEMSERRLQKYRDIGL